MEKSDEQIIQEFRKKRKRQIILAPIALFAVILVLLVNPISIIIGSIIILIAFIYSLKNWRCPVCNRYLGRGVNLKKCPKCEAKFWQE
ncbi:hypothetical protein KAW65_01465 [candidate division WOR-3 bacterium]|nr:hypothetical protein [candidate division WOR-3 bacterium]